MLSLDRMGMPVVFIGPRQLMHPYSTRWTGVEGLRVWVRLLRRRKGSVKRFASALGLQTLAPYVEERQVEHRLGKSKRFPKYIVWCECLYWMFRLTQRKVETSLRGWVMLITLASAITPRSLPSKWWPMWQRVVRWSWTRYLLRKFEASTFPREV